MIYSFNVRVLCYKIMLLKIEDRNIIMLTRFNIFFLYNYYSKIMLDVPSSTEYNR